MGSPKGSSLANLGYSCEQRELIRGWREIWSETPGTTDPLAPFGVVTLASSGAEGSDFAMGAMRIAQTAGYGVLPSPELPNTFLAQAYDLDDAWGPTVGPCFPRSPKLGESWQCCDKDGQGPIPYPRNPPDPPPPSAPIQCNAPGNWLNQTAFINGKYVAFGVPNPRDKKSTTGMVHANSSEACCSICANATLQKLGCAYWQYYQDRSGPAHGQCIMTTTRGNYSAVGSFGRALAGYSKWTTSGGIRKFGPVPAPPPPLCTPAQFEKCKPACAAAADTPVAMGAIHPRTKKPVGDRLGTAAYNTVYKGDKAYTGPTLSGCRLDGGTLTISFNSSLLKGDKVVLQKYGKGTYVAHGKLVTGGSYLDVQTNANNFCMEPAKTPAGELYCPTWAGGTGKPINGSNTQLNGGWETGLDITLSADGGSIMVDLSPLNGSAPTAVRYAWDIVNCCDMNDPDLYVSKPCGPASCPIMSSSNLPANPFLAKIVNGKCECIPPQVC